LIIDAIKVIEKSSLSMMKHAIILVVEDTNSSEDFFFGFHNKEISF